MHLHTYIKSISRDLYRAAVARMTDVATKTEDNLVGAVSPVSIEDSSSCETHTAATIGNKGVYPIRPELRVLRIHSKMVDQH